MSLSYAVRKSGVHFRHDVDFWRVRGSAKELTSEIVRLFVLDSNDDHLLEAMGVSQEEMAAYRFSTLAEPGGVLFVAERAGRLEGLLFLAPDGLQSAVLGHYIWSVRQLVTSPDASSGTAGGLLQTALRYLDFPVDCVVARVPARNRAAVGGLQRQGFQALGSRVVGVLQCRARSVKEPTNLDLIPVQKSCLREAADFLLKNGDCFNYPSSTWLRAERMVRLYECQLAEYVEEPRAGGVVAKGPFAEILGLITYRRKIWLGEFTSHRLASLDFFGVRPGSGSDGLGEVLHRHALSALYAESVDAVEVRTVVARPEAAGKLEMLRKLGCKAFSSELIFQRWLTRGASLC